MNSVAVPEILGVVRGCLRDIGYQEDLLLSGYKFWDFWKKGGSGSAVMGGIELAAFAQTPASLRSACFGVTIASEESPASIARFRALGAPQILALHLREKLVRRWKIPAIGDPEPLDAFPFDAIASEFQRKKQEWTPERILSAKTLAFSGGPMPLDFIDAGLLSANEAHLRSKLSRDIQNVLVRCRNVYEQWHLNGDFDSVLAPVFRLIFRLIAAKMLIDREDKPNWGGLDAPSVIREVEAFYFREEQAEQALADEHVQTAAWEQIRSGLNLQNISVETLAYVYENAFVTQSVRRRMGVHATPQELAEYTVRQLPIEQLNWQERVVFEPFTGAAPFLTAALGRLRELLSETHSASERHDYFVKMLFGLESDPFAREIARYSLILADYPNPDGWHIDVANAFIDKRFNTYLNSANIVLCNPPHEDFEATERMGLSADVSVNKGAEALRRVLERQPAMLGFVLPRSFLDRSAFRQLRQDIATRYKNVAITVLPDKTFKKASQEVVLIIADNIRVQDKPYSYAFVTAGDYETFLRTGTPSFKESYIAPVRTKNDVVFWRTPLQPVWEALANYPVLDSLADIHVGIHYKTGLLAETVSDEPQANFTEGIARVRGYFEPYLLSDYQYLCTTPDVMRDKAYLLPWNRPKVLVNRARLSRNYWNVSGAVDDQGLWPLRQFYGVWPKEGTSIEVLAAVISGPIANAYMYNHRSGRDNQIRGIKQIPVPKFTEEQAALIVSLVQDYYSQRGQWLAEPRRAEYLEDRCLRLLYQIDAAVLEAYALPAELERELLDKFKGVERRPLPFHFPGYGEEYEQAQKALQEEKAYRALLKSYHALVDKKYLAGLSSAEADEMERLRRGIDAHNAPFYEPILQALSAADH